MERSEEYQDLALALAELRPEPRLEIAQELDERVAAGFPRRPRLGGSRLGALGDRVREISSQRLLFAGGGTALAAIAAATVIVAGSNPGPPTAFDSRVPKQGSGGELLSGFQRFSGPAESEVGAAKPESAGSADAEYSAAGNLSAGAARLARNRHRDIERSTEIGLLADSDDVADDSSAVFDAVHDAHGIVLHSTTTSGKRAGARFDLLIPSARLGDALAAFSAIDEVRTRHEATEDITAPTVEVSERLQDSRARIDGLLAQLSSAETETEMAAIEAELARERRHAAQLRSHLDKLEQRTDFSRVSVRIETGTSSDSEGSWGVGDAFGDAGHILSIAAGVTLVGLAVLAPLTLLGLIAWLTHRAWLRRVRSRALA
jgi:Domain of unknown function (DUF4349)